MGKKIIIIAGLFILRIHCWGQNVKDLGLWTSISLEKEIFKRWELSLKEEIRFNNNITDLNTIMSDIGIQYSWNRNLSTSANYRFLQKKDRNEFNNRHRYYIDLNVQIKRLLHFVSRIRFHSQYNEIYSRENGMISKDYFRYKIQLQNPNLLFKPFVGYEFFYSIKENDFTKNRYFAGINLKFNEIHSLEPLFMLQHDTGNEFEEIDYIMGLNYKIKL